MITCNEGKNMPCLMKLTHYLRYYQQRYGIQLSREMAEKEAAREGIVLDLSGASEPKSKPKTQAA
jgi:hypothetical protein